MTSSCGQAFSLLALVLGVWLGLAVPVFAQDGHNVLIVFNATSASGEQIAARYAAARSVPSDNILRLTVAATDDVDRASYVADIERPIAEWLGRRAAQDRILYFVLAKGIPLRIRGTEGLGGTVASVDSELTLLYRKMLGMSTPQAGRAANPYFLAERALKDAQQFSHRTADIYLVTRLDGFTVADVFRVIDRGAAPAREGQFLLDQKGNLLGDRTGDLWLAAAAKELASQGFGDRVVLDSSSEVLSGKKQVLGYYSWGSNDTAIRKRKLGLGFVPGSLAAAFVSTDGRTFTEPPDSWSIGTWSDPKTHYAGSPQWLVGDLIREGATGVAGHVAEPYLDATIRPQVLFPTYVAGFNLAESFYLAMPYVSWQTVVVGDPLCAPFRSQKLSREDAAPALDQETELPKFFSDRRIASLSRAGVAPATVKLLLKAEARLAHGNDAGARHPLEMVTSMEPGANTARHLLAGVYERAAEHDRTIEQYRAILITAPNDVRSLNNLAYALAVHKGAPADGLPFAERAYKLASNSALVADTLGWIHYLLGHQADAERFLAEAVKGAPDNAEIQLHVAEIYTAGGRKEEARAALSKALSLDPAMAKRQAIADLGSRLK
ncbi:MAG TPA: TIGR03790 family protein [Vicinamibacterales bacterium]|nr:TIGR03790 family protein [Vicinamibacterales bacterium]